MVVSYYLQQQQEDDIEEEERNETLHQTKLSSISTYLVRLQCYDFEITHYPVEISPGT